MDVLRRKLRYRSINRGCKETDILIGNFAIHHLNAIADDKLTSYAKILEENDADLYNILLEKQPIPNHLDKDLIRQIIQFHQKTSSAYNQTS